MEMIMAKKKKKGFTLVELIAVIAILAILGAILVPKISGYSTKATAAKDLTNAKAIISAYELFNADHNGAEAPETVKFDVAATVDFVTGTDTVVHLGTYMSTMPKGHKAKTHDVTANGEWSAMTIAAIRAYSVELDD